MVFLLDVYETPKRSSFDGGLVSIRGRYVYLEGAVRDYGERIVGQLLIIMVYKPILEILEEISLERRPGNSSRTGGLR